jgi:hypothetical protein
MEHRNLPTLLRDAERRVNARVFKTGGDDALASIPANRDRDVDLLLMEAANLIEHRDRQVAAIVTWLQANQPDVFERGMWDAGCDPTTRRQRNTS